MIILAGSLFGVQLGAIGTTYVKDFMVKVVMGVIMMLVLVSRGLKVPVYLAEIGEIDPLSPSLVSFLDITSYIMLIAALAVGAFIILYALVSGYRKHTRKLAAESAGLVEQSKSKVTEVFPTETTQLSPIGRFERILFANDNSEFGVGAKREAIRLVQRIGGNLSIISVIVNHSANEFMAQRTFEKESQDAIDNLEVVKSQAIDAGIDCTISVHQGENITNEIISASEEKHSDLIVIGRRGKKGLLQSIMGDRTNEIIYRSSCSVLVVPKAAKIKGKSILLAVADGSHSSDMAAVAAGKLAIHLNAPLIVLSVTSAKLKEDAEAIVARICHFLRDDGVTVESKVVVNEKSATTIVETAKNIKSDLIVVGSQGCADLQKTLLGTSVSKRVIGTAECAVLVVKT
jgi:nucleotide-binding universal stress UspA family protein